MKCDDCGVDKEDDSVEETCCSYNEDVHSHIIECVLCADCYNTRCNDI